MREKIICCRLHLQDKGVVEQTIGQSASSGNTDNPIIAEYRKYGFRETAIKPYDSFGFPNHYVVIEKATKRQKLIKLGRDRWDDRDVFFTVNIGNGGESKELWTREAGRDDHKHYSTFDVFLIDLK